MGTIVEKKSYAQALISTDDLQHSKQQAFYIKCNDSEKVCNSSAEMTSALKEVQAISMKKLHDNTIKLVLLKGDTKHQVIEKDTYKVACEKKNDLK